MNIFSDKTLVTQYEKHFKSSRKIHIAKNIISEFKSKRLFNYRSYSKELNYSLKLLTNQLFQCQNNIQYNNTFIIDSAFQLVKATTPYLGKDDLNMLWDTIMHSPCYKSLSIPSKNWLMLHKNLAIQNFTEALKLSNELLKSKQLRGTYELNEYLFAGAVISAIKTNRIKLARSIWKNMYPIIKRNSDKPALSLRLLLAHLNSYPAH